MHIPMLHVSEVYRVEGSLIRSISTYCQTRQCTIIIHPAHKLKLIRAQWTVTPRVRLRRHKAQTQERPPFYVPANGFSRSGSDSTRSFLNIYPISDLRLEFLQ